MTSRTMSEKPSSRKSPSHRVTSSSGCASLPPKQSQQPGTSGALVMITVVGDDQPETMDVSQEPTRFCPVCICWPSQHLRTRACTKYAHSVNMASERFREVIDKRCVNT